MIGKMRKIKRRAIKGKNTDKKNFVLGLILFISFIFYTSQNSIIIYLVSYIFIPVRTKPLTIPLFTKKKTINIGVIVKTAAARV